jgi:hypothetical protein
MSGGKKDGHVQASSHEPTNIKISPKMGKNASLWINPSNNLYNLHEE